MKRVFSVFLAFTLVLSITIIGNTAVFADQSGDFTYSISNNTATITGYTGAGGAVTIPDTLGGVAVTSIGDKAFIRCTVLTSITIPNSVSQIGAALFAGCSKLLSINVDASNSNFTSVGGVLFNKNQTELLDFPSGVTGAYSIPSGVTSIGSGAFSSCSGLVSITLPNSVTCIDTFAFLYCSGLTSIRIPNSVTSIGTNAFDGCTRLTSITIPSGVTSIGYDAFDGTPWLKNYPNDFVIAGDNILIDYKGTQSIITIPSSVISIDDSAFWSCSGLTSITIPSSVTSIGDFAFSDCLC